jgi:O-antigen/teichoic acid export membrane protein
MDKTITKGEVFNIMGKGTFWNTLFNISSKVVGIAIAAIVLTRLSVYEYGLIELILSSVAVLNIFVLPGLSSTVVSDMSVEIAEGNGLAAKSLLRSYFNLQVVLALLAFSLIILMGSFLGKLSHTSSIYFFILSFNFITSPFRSLFITAFSVSHEFFKRNAFSFFEEVSKLAIILVFLFSKKIEVGTVILSSVLAPVIPIIIFSPFLIRTLKSFNFGLNKSFPIKYYIFNHGIWGVFTNYANNFGQAVRLWLVKFFIGTEAVAVASLAQTLMAHTLSIFNFQSVLGPVLSRYTNDIKRLSILAVKSVKYQMVIFVLLAVFVAIAFPLLLVLLFPKYEPVIPIFTIMLISVIPHSFAVVLSPLYNTFKAQKELFSSVMLKNGFIVLYSAIFLPVFGIYGVAFEYVLTILTFTVERYRRIKRRLPDFSISPKNIFSFDENDEFVFQMIKQKFFKLSKFASFFRK